MIKLKNLLKENESSINLAYQKINSLPIGKLFDDAKNIEGIFKMSKHDWNKYNSHISNSPPNQS